MWISDIFSWLKKKPAYQVAIPNANTGIVSTSSVPAKSELSILFWNIGEKLTAGKLSLVSELIQKHEPDVLCIAEGSYSAEACRELVKHIEKEKYSCYYSPLFCYNKAYGLKYPYTRTAVKVFLRDKTITEDFVIGKQMENGKVILLTVKLDGKTCSIYLLHNYAKQNNRMSTTEQGTLLTLLSRDISFRHSEGLSDSFLVIGDFNLEPWDDVLREDGVFATCFLTKHYRLFQRKRSTKKTFFNPVTEAINGHVNENLGGTRYGGEFGWALFDYVVYDDKEMEVNYSIITEISPAKKLVKADNTLTKDFIDGFDHLPIFVKLKHKP